MAGKRGKPKYKALALSLVISAAILAAGFMLIDGLTAHIVLTRLLKPLLRLMGFIVIGLAAGQIIEASGWTRTLSLLARPFFRFGNLGERCSAAFTAAFFSGVAANAMLLDFYKDGKISREQLFLSNFVNHFPAYFLHLPTTFFMVIPLTGKAGFFYFGITLLAMLLRTALFLVYGHVRLKKHEVLGESAGEVSGPGKKEAGIWAGIKRKLPARVVNIAVFVLPVYIAVFVINALGFFRMANDFVSTYVTVNFMPVESLSVVILSFAAEFTSGFAAAGALMDAGVITTKQTVIALVTGNIIAFPIRALRHQLPRYIGIFSPRMGSQLLFMGQGFRIASLVVTTLFYYFIF